MTINDTMLNQVLADHGFDVGTTTFMPMVTASLRLGDEWRIQGHSKGSGPEWDSFDFGLVPVNDARGGKKGTVHRCLSEAALRSHLSGIIDSLRDLTSTPDKLRCPKCGVRWVHMKEPGATGRQWPPFLSCDGMQIVRKSVEGTRIKEPACDGTRRDLPALIKYP